MFTQCQDCGELFENDQQLIYHISDGDCRSTESFYNDLDSEQRYAASETYVDLISDYGDDLSDETRLSAHYVAVLSTITDN